jgi:hypothetical protein
MDYAAAAWITPKLRALRRSGMAIDDSNDDGLGRPAEACLGLRHDFVARTAGRTIEIGAVLVVGTEAAELLESQRSAAAQTMQLAGTAVEGCFDFRSLHRSSLPPAAHVETDFDRNRAEGGLSSSLDQTMQVPFRPPGAVTIPEL